LKFSIIISLFVFFLLGTKTTISQDTWSKRFGDINYNPDTPNLNGENCTAISYNDSGIVLIYGWVGESLTYWRTRFMEISNDGNQNYIKDYGVSDEFWSGPFNGAGCKTNDSGFAYPGGIVPFNENNGMFPTLTKFNSVGDTLWKKEYFDASKFYSADNVIQCTDGGFALVGGTSPDSLEYNPQIFVLKVDSLGNEIWYEEYGNQTISAEYGLSIAETNEGGFIIGGYKNATISSNPNHYLLAIDSIGNFLWHQTIGNSTFREGAMNVRGLSDGNFICVSGRGIYVENDDTYSQSYIRKINSDGDILWDHYIGPIDPSSIFLSSEENEDGSIIVHGSTRTQSFTNQLGGKVATLTKFSPEGDSLWMREYSYAVEESPEAIVWHRPGDVTTLPDGGYAAVGWVLVSDLPDYPCDSPGQDLWVFKTDSMGCLVAGCDTVVGIKEYNETIDQTWFTYGPNPVRNQLTIYLTQVGIGLFNEFRFELRNLEGKLIKEFTASKNGGISYILELNDQIPGLYILSLYGDGKRLQSEKIIIQ